MQPILEYIVSVWTTVTPWAMTILSDSKQIFSWMSHRQTDGCAHILHVDTSNSRVLEFLRVSASGLFSIVSQRARRPIMSVEFWTLVNLSWRRNLTVANNSWYSDAAP